MIVLFVFGVFLVVVALGLVSAALKGTSGPRGVSGGLAMIDAIGGLPKSMIRDEDAPFAERVLQPIQNRALKLGRRLSGGDSAERIRHKLELAGNPAGWTVDRVLSAKVIGAASGIVFGLLLSYLLGTTFTTRVLLALAGGGLGFLGPGFFLYQKAYDRGALLQRELPDAIDLLTISVEAGLGFDAALQQVARNTDGPLADEFSRVLREMQIGQGRSSALRGLSERTAVADVRTFVGAMVQADSFGIPIAEVLRVQSREIRVKRRQRAEEKAQAVPVKMTVPLIFCILPCLFVAVLGPAALSIMDNL